MIEPTRFALEALPSTPWKNGGGSTREVACWPPGAGLDQFAWRISVATIARAGPFSRFPGVDRIIALLGGDGVRLASEDGLVDHRLAEPLQPFAFSGDVAVDCDLLAGESTDINVMVRRGHWQASVTIVDDDGLLPTTTHGLLMVTEGSWTVSMPVELRLEAGEGLWWGGVEVECGASRCSARASMIVVRLTGLESESMS